MNSFERARKSILDKCDLEQRIETLKQYEDNYYAH